MKRERKMAVEEELENMGMESYSKEWKEANNMAGLFQRIMEDCKVIQNTSKQILFPISY